MSLLFDASSVFELIKVKGADALRYVKGNYTISLVHYELGNVLWKYRNKINVELVFDAIAKLLSEMNVIHVNIDKEILNEAIKHNITYYDMAYLLTSKRLNVKLVTEDKKLIEFGGIKVSQLNI
jgi:predicted nucleic acid-binding protein